MFVWLLQVLLIILSYPIQIVKRFVAAIDEADRDRTPKQTLPGRQLTNPQEILALMSKRKKQTLKY